MFRNLRHLKNKPPEPETGHTIQEIEAEHDINYVPEPLTDRVEAVKTKLDEMEYELTLGCYVVDKTRVAKEICSLFEPIGEEELR